MEVENLKESKMNKKVVVPLVIVLIILGLACGAVIGLFIKNSQQQANRKNEVEIKTDKDLIYGLFNNFPESDEMYYTYHSLYNERDIGPTIYQIEILAELAEEAYDNFVNEAELDNSANMQVEVNPQNIEYDWENVRNTGIIESKNIENASIKNIYLDKSKKTIYVIAIGGN